MTKNIWTLKTNVKLKYSLNFTYLIKSYNYDNYILTPATPMGTSEAPTFLIHNNFFQKSFLKNSNTEKNSNTLGTF